MRSRKGAIQDGTHALPRVMALHKWIYCSFIKGFALVTRPDGAMLRAGQLNKEEQSV